MYGEASFAETGFGETLGTGIPIIPEVGLETRQLVYVLELELIAIAGDELPPEPPPTFSVQALFDALGQGGRQVTAALDAVGQPAAIPGVDTFWLSPTGNDTTGTGSNALPWKTFAKANSVVTPGDTVILKAGTYVEDTIVLDTPGSAGNPITYRSEVRHAAIVQPVNGQAGLEIILGDADYIVLDGLRVDGTPYPELLGGITQQGSHTETKNCWVHNIRCLGATDGGSGILTGNGPTAAYDQVDNKVYNCRINDIGNLAVPSALVHGIYLSHVDAECFNNLIYRVEGGGIHLWHRASDIMIHNNTMFDCRNSGIIAGHGTEPEPPISLNNTKVSNNIVIDCPNGIRSSGAQGTGNEARNNTCFRCGTPFSLAASWGVSGSSTTDPGLVNYLISGGGDYRPTTNGAAANSGIETWAPLFDYDNITRPKGPGFDRGAYEASTILSASLDAIGTGGAPLVSGMIDFHANNTSRYYTIPTNAALNLGSGVWAWGIWVQGSSNVGTSFQYLLSSGVPQNTPSFAWYGVEAGNTAGEPPNTWAMRIVDNAGVNTGALNSAATNVGDGVRRLVVIQSTGTALEMRLCPENGTAVTTVNAAINLGALTAPTVWNIGRRSDGEATRYYDSKLGGLFRANVALTGANMEAIAAGASPVTVLGANCVAFWPFANGATTTETDVVSGIVATRNGTGW